MISYYYIWSPPNLSHTTNRFILQPKSKSGGEPLCVRPPNPVGAGEACCVEADCAIGFGKNKYMGVPRYECFVFSVPLFLSS